MVQAVFDPVRTSPDGKRDWSLRSIFGRTIERACLVATSSNAELTTNGVEGYTLAPTPTVDWSAEQVEGVEGGIYEPKSVAHPDPLSDLDLSMRWTGEGKFAYPFDFTATTLSAYSVDRSMKGSIQTAGKLALSMRSNLQVEQRVLWLETLPWHLELYLHTLHVACADGRPCDELLKNLTYTPPIPHASGALLQTDILLPPGEHLQITARVRKSFLRYTEHPPDAQRGWDLPPGVLVSLEPTSALHHSSQTSQRVYTRPLLVDLATPDFSMLYNVIIMTCTLIALCFGSVFNMLTRRFLVFDAEGKMVAGGEARVVEGEQFEGVDEKGLDGQ
ncbi:Gpi16-domain-containing protein [Peniophora sp. CONT]|nr:Gpi16-domain-containing protein [Peniophora sp. CONT]